MKKVLFAVFVLLLVKMLPAQSTSSAMASVTVVHPIGTEEVGEEVQSFSSASITQSPGSFSIDYTGRKGLARFRVIDQSLVYSIAAIPYVTRNLVLQKVNEDAFERDRNTITAAQNGGVYVLGTSAGSLPCLQESKEKAALPDVVVHFN